MGKVLDTFTNGYAGAISRSIDDVVITLASKSEDPIPFGIALALDEDKTGVIPFDASSHTAADFVGISVRNPSKTPDTYGENTGSYAMDDLVDVLVRGHIVVRMSSTTSSGIGDVVSILKANGAFSAGTGDNKLALSNAHLSAVPDASGMAEIVLTTRNVL